MLVRRTFLLSVCAIGAAPLLGRGAVAGAHADIFVVNDPGGVPGAVVHGMAGASVQASGADPLDMLMELETRLARGGVSHCLGLCRGSTAQLVNEIAARHGLGARYWGTHRAGAGQVAHTLHAERDAVQILAQRLAGAGNDGYWGQELTETLFDLAALDGLDEAPCVRFATSGDSVDGAPLLASFLLSRAGS